VASFDVDPLLHEYVSGRVAFETDMEMDPSDPVELSLDAVPVIVIL
jgi:hypothetical protein